MENQPAVKRFRMKPQTVKRLVGSVCFVLVLCIILSVLSVYSQESVPMQWLLTGRYAQYDSLPKDSMDVLVFGASGVWTSLCPAVLWREYGIPSFTLCSSNQLAITTYYTVMNALRTQTPKLVILNAAMLFNFTSVDAEAREPYNTNMINAMPVSLEKYAAALDIVSKSETQTMLSFLFPIFRFHDKWENMGLKDIMPITTYKAYELGMLSRSTAKSRKPMTGYAVIENESDYDETAAKYMRMIINECKKRGIEVVLLAAISPSFILKRNEQVLKFAREENVEFFTYNRSDNLAALSINFDTDFFDDNHLNTAGALKFSKHFGAHIRDTYALPDRRGGDVYDEFDQLAMQYYREFYPDELQATPVESLYTKDLLTMEATTSEYTNTILLEDVKPGVICYVHIDKLEFSGGEEDAITVRFHDKALNKCPTETTLTRYEDGSADCYIVYADDAGIYTDVTLRLYCGKAGKTLGRRLVAENVTVARCEYVSE